MGWVACGPEWSVGVSAGDGWCTGLALNLGSKRCPFRRCRFLGEADVRRFMACWVPLGLSCWCTHSLRCRQQRLAQAWQGLSWPTHFQRSRASRPPDVQARRTPRKASPQTRIGREQELAATWNRTKRNRHHAKQNRRTSKPTGADIAKTKQNRQ